ncbi:unnamed protein product [Amoebophrya sp. A120]|nr:unnamed protein product [Amoebophrya sp. A120]|eukprot:GSA120T00022147001.1
MVGSGFSGDHHQQQLSMSQQELELQSLLLSEDLDDNDQDDDNIGLDLNAAQEELHCVGEWRTIYLPQPLGAAHREFTKYPNTPLSVLYVDNSSGCENDITDTSTITATSPAWPYFLIGLLSLPALLRVIPPKLETPELLNSGLPGGGGNGEQLLDQQNSSQNVRRGRFCTLPISGGFLLTDGSSHVVFFSPSSNAICKDHHTGPRSSSTSQSAVAPRHGAAAPAAYQNYFKNNSSSKHSNTTSTSSTSASGNLNASRSTSSRQQQQLIPIAGSGKRGYLDGPLEFSKLDCPAGLCQDPHTQLVYVCDKNNHVIRQLDFTTGLITTVCGNGQQGNADSCYRMFQNLDNPSSVSFSEPRFLLISCSDNSVRKFDVRSGVLETVLIGS